VAPRRRSIWGTGADGLLGGICAFRDSQRLRPFRRTKEYDRMFARVRLRRTRT